MSEQQLQTMGQKAESKVDSLETNSELKGCTENCRLNNDHASAQSKLATSLTDIDTRLRSDYKAIAGDSTKTEDYRSVMQYDAVEKAERNFNILLDTHIASLHTEADQRVSELFTSNSKMADTDISLLGNTSIVDKLLGDHLAYINNEANANMILHLNQRGFYSESLNVNDGLNRRYSPDAHTRLQEIESEGQLLNDIKKSQRNTFAKLKPSLEKINKIKSRQFKG